MKLFALIQMVLFVTSCVTQGREFPTRFDWIKKSKTRQEDAKLVLGDPMFVGATDGSPSWTYGHYKYSLFGASYTKELKFYWNPDRTVNSWSYTSSFPDDVSDVSAAPARPASDVSR